MQTLDEIRAALRLLTVDQRMRIEAWLQELDGIPPPDSQAGEARLAYAAVDPSFRTLEEFLEFEKTSPLRHEFINGAIFAMNGASLNHQRIVLNLTMAIHNHLKRGPCEVFSSGLLVVIKRGVHEIAYHPDVMVDARPDTRETHYLREPKLIVEVLSPATQLIDSREKLLNYPLIDSLEEFVLVAQDKRHVIVYPRAEGWRPRVYSALDAAVELRSIDLTMPIIELYENVQSVLVPRPARHNLSANCD
jgi:Uma2 family endonuclease